METLKQLLLDIQNNADAMSKQCKFTGMYDIDDENMYRIHIGSFVPRVFVSMWPGNAILDVVEDIDKMEFDPQSMWLTIYK